MEGLQGLYLMPNVRNNASEKAYVTSHAPAGKEWLWEAGLGLGYERLLFRGRLQLDAVLSPNLIFHYVFLSYNYANGTVFRRVDYKNRSGGYINIALGYSF